MNLFLCPPSQLDQPRLGKQIIEAMQLYATAKPPGWPNAIKANGEPYKPTHQNHPVTRWAARHAQNAYFCVTVAKQCGAEWLERYGTMHAACKTALELGTNFIHVPTPHTYIVCRTGCETIETKDLTRARALYSAYIAKKQES